VFFVKNVRRSSSGNLIRTLPMIIAALRGEVAINIRGESSVNKANKLVSTFRKLPDAPVSRFALNIKGGRNGIIAVTRTRRSTIDLCDRPRQTTISRFNAHNGKRQHSRNRTRLPCRKPTKTNPRNKTRTR
jgi:hypothetical protein